jgi:hypothetical protein
LIFQRPVSFLFSTEFILIQSGFHQLIVIKQCLAVASPRWQRFISLRTIDNNQTLETQLPAVYLEMTGMAIAYSHFFEKIFGKAAPLLKLKNIPATPWQHGRLNRVF